MTSSFLRHATNAPVTAKSVIPTKFKKITMFIVALCFTTRFVAIGHSISPLYQHQSQSEKFGESERFARRMGGRDTLEGKLGAAPDTNGIVSTTHERPVRIRRTGSLARLIMSNNVLSQVAQQPWPI